MKEIPVSALKVGDHGSRVVVIDESGNAYAGKLTSIHVTPWPYGKRPEDMVRTNIKVSGAEKSELSLMSLPLDYRLQIEREAKS